VPRSQSYVTRNTSLDAVKSIYNDDDSLQRRPSFDQLLTCFVFFYVGALHFQLILVRLESTRHLRPFSVSQACNSISVDSLLLTERNMPRR